MTFKFNRAYSVYSDQLDRKDIYQIDELLRSMFVDEDLCKSGTLKDYFKGKVNNLSDIELSQLDNPHLSNNNLKNLPAWQKLSSLAAKLIEKKGCRVFASHAVLKKSLFKK